MMQISKPIAKCSQPYEATARSGVVQSVLESLGNLWKNASSQNPDQGKLNFLKSIVIGFAVRMSDFVSDGCSNQETDVV